VNSTEIVLIDLSSIAFPIYLTSGSDPDPDHASQQIIARVRALASGHAHVAIACDSGRSFRHEIAPTYKANRPEREAPLYHQIGLAKEALAGDGFPVWSVAGFEADDILASATMQALATPDLTVLIISSDKDLLQLVGPRVRFQRAKDGVVLDEAGVAEKFDGVRPEQVRDYLTLCGDASDNIKGAKGIGPKGAAALLAKFGSLDEVYRRLHEAPMSMGLTPSVVTSLKEFEARMPTVRKLITLRVDVEIPFVDINNERVAKAEFVECEMDGFEEDAVPAAQTSDPGPAAPPASPEAVPADPPTSPGIERVYLPSGQPAPKPDSLIVRPQDILAPPPAEWERQLDPRSMREAQALASDMFRSHMFDSYGSAPAVLSTIMVGRELGIPAMASLRSVHNIKGRHALSADLMVALILKSGLAEYFEPVSFSELEATWETKRRGGKKPHTMQHTIEMAKTAGVVKPESNWITVPTDMLNSRAKSRLARLIYPDLLANVYSPEELAEMREQVAA
jgi:5'-3' exonuclease